MPPRRQPAAPRSPARKAQQDAWNAKHSWKGDARKEKRTDRKRPKRPDKRKDRKDRKRAKREAEQKASREAKAASAAQPQQESDDDDDEPLRIAIRDAMAHYAKVHHEDVVR